MTRIFTLTSRRKRANALPSPLIGDDTQSVAADPVASTIVDEPQMLERSRTADAAEGSDDEGMRRAEATRSDEADDPELETFVEVLLERAADESIALVAETEAPGLDAPVHEGLAARLWAFVRGRRQAN